jgi:hypothetical protein
VLVALALIAGACSSAAPGASATPALPDASATPGASPAPATPGPSTIAAGPGVIALVAPAANAIVTQNDPALATKCPAGSPRGNGYDLEFSWTGPADLARVDHFEVVLQHGTSIPIVFEVDDATATSLSALQCNTFVTDTNRGGWHWQVKALDNGKKVLASSEQRSFTFGPCQLANGTACNAPA